jgi:hypothetical protein
MKRTLRTLGALAALAMPAALSAQATSSEKAVGFGVSGGLSLPMGDLSDGVEAGYNVTGHVFLKPAALKAFRLRGDVSYDSWSGKTEGVSASSLGFMGNAVFDLGTSGSSVKPYILGGVGMHNSKSKASFGGADLEFSNTDLAIQAGVGLTFQLSGFSTFAEARFVNVFGEEESANFVPIVFGIRF